MKLKNNSGFTLIELLVVIGILGILAAALIATIDPFEQLKKADDSNTKNTTVEFVNANIRYYTTHNELPWSSSGDDCNTAVGGTSFTGANLNSMSACTVKILADGELKPGFTTITNVLKNIYVTATDKDVVACFKPVSKAQQNDLNTKWSSSGEACTGAQTTCYWCAK